MSVQTLIMAKERLDQFGQFLDAARGAQRQRLHVVLGLDKLAADTSLDMCSDLLIRIELGRVQRQEEQLQLAGLALDVLTPSTAVL